MQIEPADVNTWEQLSLDPPPIIEITFRVGIVHETQHGQIQLEASVPTTGKLLALWSRPHVDLSALEDEVREAGREFTRMVREHAGPFA